MSEIIIDKKILKSFDDTYYIGEYGEVYSTYSKRL